MTRTGSAQRISAREAAELVRSGDWLDYGAVLGQPDVFDQALAERVSELRD
jgi:acyl-CoA hydrolase